MVCIFTIIWIGLYICFLACTSLHTCCVPSVYIYISFVSISTLCIYYLYMFIFQFFFQFILFCIFQCVCLCIWPFLHSVSVFFYSNLFIYFFIYLFMSFSIDIFLCVPPYVPFYVRASWNYKYCFWSNI